MRVLRYTSFQDVGRAIHPSYVEGQMQGGVAQGIGWALNEEYIYNTNGQLDNPGFLDYRMPVCSDLPMLDTVIIEVPNPKHPQGVRGVGEVPLVPPLGGGGERRLQRPGPSLRQPADVAAEGAGDTGADEGRGGIAADPGGRRGSGGPLGGSIRRGGSISEPLRLRMPRPAIIPSIPEITAHGHSRYDAHATGSSPGGCCAGPGL